MGSYVVGYRMAYHYSIFGVFLVAYSYGLDDGGWYTDPATVLAKPGPCNIDFVNNSLTQEQFMKYFAFKKPFVIHQATDNRKFRKSCSKENLLKKYGNKTVRLSTANTYSYKKVDVPLSSYIREHMQPQNLKTHGNETLYWFGDNSDDWNTLFDTYKPPPFKMPKTFGAYSFGAAGAGTGVPFHFHGPGYAEMIFGQKRWFLYPPDKIPSFHPNQTTLQWLFYEYPKLKQEDKPLECTISPGQAIYFPDHWWHATLNIDNSVFISTFLGHK